MLDKWLLRFGQRSEAAVRLFCFAHAGGSAASYRLWPQGLPSWIEVLAVQLPGRATRLGEPPIGDLELLIDSARRALEPMMDRPYALFGHSMGAVLAGELARSMCTDGARAPSHLIVSGRRPARLMDALPPMNGLSDDAFVAEINHRYGGIPKEIMEHPDVLALLLPGLRADIRALETFNPAPRSPIACSIAALGGSADPLTTRAHMEAWRDETTGAFRMRMFEGNHFYLEPRRSEVLAEIADVLAPLNPINGRERRA